MLSNNLKILKYLHPMIYTKLSTNYMPYPKYSCHFENSVSLSFCFLFVSRLSSLLLLRLLCRRQLSKWLLKGRYLQPRNPPTLKEQRLLMMSHKTTHENDDDNHEDNGLDVNEGDWCFHHCRRSPSVRIASSFQPRGPSHQTSNYKCVFNFFFFFNLGLKKFNFYS